MIRQLLLSIALILSLSLNCGKGEDSCTENGTDIEMARITELSKEASRKYDGLRQLHGEKNARELTVIWLKKQDIVKDAKISEDERTISIILKNDVRMNILTR